MHTIALILLLFVQQPLEYPSKVVESRESVAQVIAVYHRMDGNEKVRSAHQGSAVYVGDHLWLSAKHVFSVNGMDPTSVLVDGNAAEEVWLAKNHDAAVIKVPADTPRPAIRISKSPIKLGQSAYGIGWRHDKQRTWKTIVKAKGFYPGDMIEDVSHADLGNTGGAVGGNSGGALVNEDGDLVGIVIACESFQKEPVDGSGTTVSITPQAISEVLLDYKKRK